MQAQGTEGGSTAPDVQAKAPARTAESNVEPPVTERDGSDERATANGPRKPESKIRTKLRRARRTPAAPARGPRGIE